VRTTTTQRSEHHHTITAGAGNEELMARPGASIEKAKPSMHRSISCMAKSINWLAAAFVDASHGQKIATHCEIGMGGLDWLGPSSDDDDPTRRPLPRLREWPMMHVLGLGRRTQFPTFSCHFQPVLATSDPSIYTSPNPANDPATVQTSSYATGMHTAGKYHRLSLLAYAHRLLAYATCC
jgi:hypothetical protein